MEWIIGFILLIVVLGYAWYVSIIKKRNKRSNIFLPSIFLKIFFIRRNLL